MKFTVRNSCDNDILVLQAATWELRSSGGELCGSGTCEIDGRDIYALVELSAPGKFKLTVTVEVPPEVLKYDLDLTVTG